MAGYTLWLVRHARPLVDEGVCYGRTDMPADATQTLATAQTLSQALAHALPEPTPEGAPLHLLASPLQRTRQLVHALAAALPQAPAPVIDERLAEMDFGAWEGQRWGDLSPLDFEAWTRDFPQHRVGGGESVAQLMTRVAAAWQDTRATLASQGVQTAVWVTHAGVIRAMHLLRAGVSCPANATEWPRQAPGFGEWTVLTMP